MISKEELLKTLGYYIDNDDDFAIEGDKLKLTRGNYEYYFNADEVHYTGDGSEFIVVSLADSGWAASGNPAVINGTVTLDGASWLTRGAVELGGKDFQISGTVYEDPADMIARRKIFELYTNETLNLSLYSSGAGKNLDLLINCGGTFDNYTEPALLEVEYTFAIKWNQAAGLLKLYVGGAEVYSVAATGLGERRTFEQVILGASAYHTDATWKGTIANFKIYDGYAEA